MWPFGSSLLVQWLRLCVPNTGDAGSVPDQGHRTHKLQLSVYMPQVKTLHHTKKI